MGNFSMIRLWCGVFVVAAITEACHASDPSGYCAGRYCGNDSNNDTMIKYPFRLLGDAAGNTCYTYFTELQFVCLNEALYLNITPNVEFSYQVQKIDYIRQTLDVLPIGNSMCRQFDPNEFVPLNVTSILNNATRNPLECNTSNSMFTECRINNSTSSNSSCPGSQGGYSCAFLPGNYGATNTNNSCYLYKDNTTVLQLGWVGGSANVTFSSTPPPPPPPPTEGTFEYEVCFVFNYFVWTKMTTAVGPRYWDSCPPSGLNSKSMV